VFMGCVGGVKVVCRVYLGGIHQALPRAPSEDLHNVRNGRGVRRRGGDGFISVEHAEEIPVGTRRHEHVAPTTRHPREGTVVRRVVHHAGVVRGAHHPPLPRGVQVLVQVHHSAGSLRSGRDRSMTYREPSGLMLMQTHGAYGGGGGGGGAAGGGGGGGGGAGYSTSVERLFSITLERH